MNGKRAKELRGIARGLSDTWTNYIAIRQRDTFGRPVRPHVTEDGCIISAGIEIRHEEGTGMQMYRRMKRHYKRSKAYPQLYAKRIKWLREAV